MKDILSIVWANLTQNTRRTTLMAAPFLAMNVTLLGCYYGAYLGTGVLEQRIEERGGDLFYVDPSVQDQQPKGFSEAVAPVVKSVPGVHAASSFVQMANPGTALSEMDTATSSTELRASALLVGEGFFDVIEAEFSDGRPFDSLDYGLSRHVAVLGIELARSYGLPADDGELVTIRIGGRPATVVGILESNARLSMLDNSVVMPQDATFVGRISADQSGGAVVERVIARAEIANVNEVATYADQVLDSQIDDRLIVDFDAGLRQSYLDGLSGFRVAVLGAAIVATLGALTAGIQVQNSGYRLRRPEFGIRMALGYDKPKVAIMLWLESVIVGLGTVVLALTLALVLGAQLSIPWRLSLSMGIGLAAVTAAVSTALPLLSVLRLGSQQPADLVGWAR